MRSERYKGGAPQRSSQNTALPLINMAGRNDLTHRLAPATTDAAQMASDQMENDEPQPQVVVALGLLMTKREPSSPSL